MSKKNIAPKSFAEEGLEDVLQDMTQAEEAVSINIPTETAGDDDMVQVGGVEPVDFFYRTSAPKKATKSPFQIIEKGQTITGVYERSFISGKFNNSTFIVRQTDGKLVGLPGAGSLTKAMSKLAEGSKVKITYDGMQAIKGGQWEGQDAHIFTVFGSKLKQA